MPTERKVAPWIQTFSGIAFDLVDPQPEMVSIIDIAHSLSRICRYTGHVLFEGYSVAEHSIHVASILPERFSFEGLMHDAIEAYIGDVSSPLKSIIGPEYRNIEARVREAIASKFHLEENVPYEVKRADLFMLNYERVRLLREAPRPWGEFPKFPEFEGVDLSLQHWRPYDAENEFLLRFAQLKDKTYAL